MNRQELDTALLLGFATFEDDRQADLWIANGVQTLGTRVESELCK